MVHTGVVTDTQHGVRTLANAHSHDALSGVSTGDHHPQVHAPETHTGQGATAAELETLTDASAGVTLHTHVANPVEATQAQMEAETAGVLYVPPDLFKNSPAAGKGWCHITAAGALESPDYNVASVTDTGTGNRTVVWGTDFSTAVYVCAGESNDNSGDSIKVAKYTTFAVGSVQLLIRFASNSVLTDELSNVIAFGDQ